MKTIQFVTDAKRYFDNDPIALAEVQEGDEVLVRLDFERRKAGYIWYHPHSENPLDRNPANFPEVEDDFDAVVEAFREEVTEILGE